MPDAGGRDVPSALAAWMEPFRAAFTAPTWQHALILVTGAILVPGQRTVASVLRVMGLDQVAHFTNYHRVLNRNIWSGRGLSRRLLRLLGDSFVAGDAPVVIGLDDTIERRWVMRIKARGIYRDPVRSSHGHFVKASGLRWLSLMLLAEIPWAGRCWGTPVPHRPGPLGTVLARAQAGQAAAQEAHRLDVRPWVTMITRLRLDAALHKPAPKRVPGKAGRPPVVGKRQPTLRQRLVNPKTPWRRLLVTGWYGRGERMLDIVSGTAVWNHPGRRVPIRYVLVRDPQGELEPQAFLCTDLDADPLDILRWFIRRWSIEVTFAEVRRHLGVETQRQWSEPAIARTTPILLGLFSLITLWADEHYAGRTPVTRIASWYRKSLPTFSDALACIRRDLWAQGNISGSRQMLDPTRIPAARLNTLIDLACYAA
jgi:DDE superfamily endonuclease